LNIFVSGDNLLFFSQRDGFNTSTSESGGSDTYRYSPLSTFSLGLKVEVVKKENSTFILLQSYQSCFRLMERLHWDFDFSVHKKNNKYIIEL
jgi:hypothetical protein